MPEKTPRDPQPAPHDLILESRARLTVTGVQKVLHCNADSAAMETGKGTLHLTGAQLNMAALDLETGEAKFTGRIDTLEYTASAPAGGFLRRLVHQLIRIGLVCRGCRTQRCNHQQSDHH